MDEGLFVEVVNMEKRTYLRSEQGGWCQEFRFEQLEDRTVFELQGCC